MYFSLNIFSGFLLLQKCDIIQQLTRSEQLSILDKLRPMEYHPGDVVIRQGDCVGDEDDGEVFSFLFFRLIFFSTGSQTTKLTLIFF